MPLSTENLQAGYGGGTVIDDINLRFPAGKITALIGPNGCGKSTLLKCLSRLLLPARGKVILAGNDLHHLPGKMVARQLALLPQQQHIPEGINVQELVSYGRSPWMNIFGCLNRHDKAFVRQAMAATQVSEFADIALTELSGGQCQRVYLAMVLAQQTPLLLLDEPGTYLDLNHQLELMALLGSLNQQGKTIIMVLHDLNQACRYCHHLVVMSRGKVVAEGAPAQVMSSRLLSEVFGLRAQIYPDPVAGTPMCIADR